MKQVEALEVLKTGMNVFLTGEPGSGKTHTINAYAAWLRECGIDPAVTASTGIAATHIDGMTVHAWSGIDVKRDITDYEIEAIMEREKVVKRIMSAKVLVIDEISMLDARTLDSIDRVLRRVRRRPLMPEQSFGGLQVIFVGDFFQLPPVSRGEQAQFAFESNAWRAANPVVCYLSEQHRQEDADFLELLSAMRHGSVAPRHKEQLHARLGAVPKKSVATRLATHNEIVDRINEASLAAIDAPTRVFTMTSRGPGRLVESLKARCLSPETLVLKEGAAVMFTRNNFDIGYVNGTLGTVRGFSADGLPIVKTRSGTITVERADWVVDDGGKTIAKISQLPLRLAWAITVHKSQGMSLDAAVIDLSQAFEFGQGYVALSRVRSLAGLYLEGFNERALMMHPKVMQADTGFRAYSDAARKKFATLSEREKHKLEENFLRAIGGNNRAVPRPKAVREPHVSPLEAMREMHVNAYKKWTAEEDDRLQELFETGKTSHEIAADLGRKAGAINSRLMHLELIPNPWAERNRKKKATDSR